MESTITYSVHGWENKNSWATFSKDGYKTKTRALHKMQRMIDGGCFAMVNLREESVYLRDEHNDFSTSGVIYSWDNEKGWTKCDGKDVTEYDQH